MDFYQQVTNPLQTSRCWCILTDQLLKLKIDGGPSLHYPKQRLTPAPYTATWRQGLLVLNLPNLSPPGWMQECEWEETPEHSHTCEELWGGTMQKCEHTYVCAQGVREESHGSFTASDWKQHMWFSFPTMLKVKHRKEHHFLVSHWNGWSAFSFYWDNSLSLPKVKNVLHSLTVCRLGVELLYQNIYSATEHHNHFKMLYSSVQRRPAVLISNSIFLSGMAQVAIQNNLYMSCADP